MASLPVRRGLNQAVYPVAIVGCGRIAGLYDNPHDQDPVSSHAQAYHRHPAFRLAAVCDPHVERLATFQRAWAVPRAYTSLADLLKHEQPAVVSLCSQTEHHFPQLSHLLEASRQIPVVFVEKPVCQRQREWLRLRELARQASEVAVLVNHTRRFDPCHKALSVLIRSGQLGRLVHGRCDYYGGWLNNGTHLVDTLRMLIGDLVVDRVALGPPGRPGDPCLDVRLLADGASIDLFGCDEAYYQFFEMDLRFEGGRIQVRNFGEEVIVERAEMNAVGERVLTPLKDFPMHGMEAPLFHAVDAIAKHLRGEGALDASGATLLQAGDTMSLIWKAADRE